LMAEETADAVCAKLGVDTRSRTAEEELPRPAEHRPLWLGVRFQDNEVERGGRDADVLCECEMVTRQMVEEFIGAADAERLDDLLRGLRVGMGPCQATFCALRAGALLQERRPRAGVEALAPVREFLEERLKGNRPILWGDQARQQRLTEIVYREVLDLEHAT
jgi:glycerol-3-phosphate dehydrogenase